MSFGAIERRRRKLPDEGPDRANIVVSLRDNNSRGGTAALNIYINNCEEPGTKLFQLDKNVCQIPPKALLRAALSFRPEFSLI